MKEKIERQRESRTTSPPSPAGERGAKRQNGSAFEPCLLPAPRPWTNDSPCLSCSFLMAVVLFLASSTNPSYILDISPLSDTWFENVFSQSLGCLPALRTVSQAVQNLLSTMWYCLLIFPFSVTLKKSFPRPISRSLLPMFSPRKWIRTSCHLNGIIQWVFAVWLLQCHINF